MNRWIDRSIGIFLIILLAGSPEVFAMAGQESASPSAQATSAGAGQQNSAQASSQGAEIQDVKSSDRDLPDSPGSLVAQQSGQEPPAGPPPVQNSQPASPDTGARQETSPAPNDSQNASQAPGNTASSSAPQQPVGAAAAQIGRTTGGAASKPAGAALAPAKQRRTRALVLKLGLLAGAGIALGTVAALSHASPSRPPGTPAH